MNCELYVSIILHFMLLIAGCGENHNNEVELANKLILANLAKSLDFPSHLHREDINKNCSAKCPFIQSIVQDMKELDSGDKFLIKTVCTYYNAGTDATLYDLNKYCLEKHCMLNVDTESAVDNLQKFSDVADGPIDKFTKNLALRILSIFIMQAYQQWFVEVTKLAKGHKEILSVVHNNSFSLFLIVIKDVIAFTKQRKIYIRSLHYPRLSNKFCLYKHIFWTLNLTAACLKAAFPTSCNKLLSNAHTENREYKYYTINIPHCNDAKGLSYAKSFDSASFFSYPLGCKSEQLYCNLFLGTKYESKVVKRGTIVLTLLIVLILIFFAASVVLALHCFKLHSICVKIKIKLGKQSQERRLLNEELFQKELQLSNMRNFILSRIDTAEKIQRLRSNKSDNVRLKDEDWEEIRLFMDAVDNNFITRLLNRFPSLGIEDLHLLMLIRLKMSTKALALIYGISEKSIKQKLFISKIKVGINGGKVSLREFIEVF